MKRKILTILLSMIIIAALLSGCGNLERDEPVTVIAKETHYYAGGSYYMWYVYEYDNAGNETKTIEYNSVRGVIGWNEWEYDSAGNRTKQIEYRTSGGIYEWTEWEYITIIPQ